MLPQFNLGSQNLAASLCDKHAGNFFALSGQQGFHLLKLLGTACCAERGTLRTAEQENMPVVPDIVENCIHVALFGNNHLNSFRRLPCTRAASFNAAIGGNETTTLRSPVLSLCLISEALLSGKHGVLHQHCNGQRADTARDRGQQRCFCRTRSKSISPRKAPLVTTLMPISMTTAPALTMSAVMNPGFPMATHRISADRQTSARPAVLLWQIVTVAFLRSSRRESGLPTIMLLRPQRHAFPQVNLIGIKELDNAMWCACQKSGLIHHQMPE